jgi:hypothetical protein
VSISDFLGHLVSIQRVLLSHQRPRMLTKRIEKALSVQS